MKKLLTITLILFAISNSSATAAPNDVVSSAFMSIKTEGKNGLQKLLYPNPDVTVNKDKIKYLYDALTEYDQECGQIIDYDLLHQAQVSPKSYIGYFTLNYENCPIYLMIGTYKTVKNGEVVTSFALNANPRFVLPDSLLGK